MTRLLCWLLAVPLGLGTALPSKADSHSVEQGFTARTPPAAADLVVTPQFGIDYQTGGGGFRDFGSVEALIPLRQTPGQNLWFLQGQARLDTVGNGGGHLLVGYRALDQSQTRMLGGYLGLDLQGTDESTFYQLGAGFERISQGWELRSNLYLPVGDRTSDLGLMGSPFFQGSQLLLPTTREVALAGGDVTVGGAIAPLGDLGDLKAYGGLYYYGHPDISGILGGRTWLALAPTDNLNVRLGIQHDGRFGTNLLFQAGFSWGRRPAAGKPDSTAVPAALAEPVQRTMPIWTVRDDQNRVAQNPATGQDYGFLHVLPAAAGGDGTIAAPYGDITNATAVAVAGEIIYVQSGNLASGFTIPDGVQVVSTAVPQLLQTQVGPIILPNSGSGTRPYVPGTITLGNDTRLSGFTIEANPAQDGIRGNNIAAVTLDNNHILTARNGILLNQVSGDVSVRQNQVQTAAQNGMLLNLSGLTAGPAILAHNHVASAGENGLLVRLADGSQVDTLTLAGNRVEAANENGIALLTESGSRLGNVALDRLQVNSAGENGIIVLADTNSTLGTVTLRDTTVTDAGANGVLLLADNGGQIGSVDGWATVITRSGANGILALADNGGRLGPVSLASSQVNQAAENGLAVLADRGASVAQASLADNQMGTVGSNGILIQASNGSTVTTAEVTRNQVVTAGGNGLLIAAQNGSQLNEAGVDDFQIFQAGANGILIQADSGSQLALTSIENAVVTQGLENGILVQADNGSQVTAVTVANSKVGAAGQNGALVLANNGSQIQTATLTQMVVGNLETAHLAIGSNGILAFADNGSTLDTVLVQSNQLGDAGATGIQVFADGRSLMSRAQILDNQLQNIAGGGILVFADGQSQLSQAAISTNILNGTGREGIQVFADGEGQLTTATIDNNQIRQTTGAGIQTFAANAAQIGRVQVNRNQLNTIGTNEDGIAIFAETGGQIPIVTATDNQLNQIAGNGLSILATQGGEMNAVSLTGNQIQAANDNGIFAFADDNGSSRLPTLTVQDNQLQQSGDNAVELGNAGANNICAVIADNTSIDAANFDANLFVTGSGDLQIVALSQLAPNNNNSFANVNNSGATEGTAGSSPCP